MTVIKTVRTSSQGRDQLIKIKRYTGLKNWNVVCRWALCASLAERTAPAANRIKSEEGALTVEMEWHTFGGEDAELYLALIRQRCIRDGLPTDDDTVREQFQRHLDRGIGYLAADKRLKSIAELVERIVPTHEHPTH